MDVNKRHFCFAYAINMLHSLFHILLLYFWICVRAPKKQIHTTANKIIQQHQQQQQQQTQSYNNSSSNNNNNTSNNSNSSKLRSLQSKDLRASHRQRLLLKLRNAQFRCGVRKSASSPERRLQEGLQRLVEDNSVQESFLEAAGVGGCGMFWIKRITQWSKHHWLNKFQ